MVVIGEGGWVIRFCEGSGGVSRMFLVGGKGGGIWFLGLFV